MGVLPKTHRAPFGKARRTKMQAIRRFASRYARSKASFSKFAQRPDSHPMPQLQFVLVYP